MNEQVTNVMVKALLDTQRALESERARNEQLVARLHASDKRETEYQQLIREQLEFIRLLEGGVPNAA